MEDMSGSLRCTRTLQTSDTDERMVSWEIVYKLLDFNRGVSGGVQWLRPNINADSTLSSLSMTTFMIMILT